ncbi:hypothetical protein [Aquabacterium humicola]|uniref:hypothetical protein n=1 Tax=Aquabacterium humicola TaxID=3237377 RepID=UPI0025431439|nr:hypothetical protein [Rubrivivax pictus]
MPELDFTRYFPHIVAVSEDKQVNEYPEGVQYKFLTVRDEVEKKVILALTRREGSTRLVRVFLANGPIENSENSLRNAVSNFAQKTGLSFEFIDLREVKTFEAYRARATELGWGMTVLQKQ